MHSGSIVGRHLVSPRDWAGERLRRLVDTAVAVKAHPQRYAEALELKSLLVLMQKTSTRTALAFTVGVHQLGGYAVRLDWADSNFGLSTIELEARYVSTTVDAVMARLLRYEDVATFAEHSTVPVTNGCCSRYHPSQLVADCLTIHEVMGHLEGVRLTYVGIHNNVTNSLLSGCTQLGMQVNLVTPRIHETAYDADLVEAADKTGLVRRYDTLAAAAADSDIVYTDTWVDMENFNSPEYEAEKQARIEHMMPFQINRANLGDARPHIMHDMPIHPGFEIDRELVDAPESIVFQQAENRLHAAKAILLDQLGPAA